MGHSPVICDSEWGYRGGRIGAESAWEPVVLVARVGGVNHHFAGRDARLRAFVSAHRDRVWVAHAATAEMRYLTRLGIEIPPRWWCTRTGYRAVSNRSGYRESSLIAALRGLGLVHLIPAHKNEIRNKILNLDITPGDWPTVIAYCTSDVIATEAVWTKIVGKIDPKKVTYWCEYLKTVARIEARGIRIDTDTLAMILRYRTHLQETQRERANEAVRVYRRNGSFCREAFWRWVDSRHIRWPSVQNERGRWARSMDDDTLELMAGRSPFIGRLRQVRKTIRGLQHFNMTVDVRTGRHYYGLLPFASVTGRNQPKRFLYGGPKWMRWLILPDRAHVLGYMDYKAQEIGIAAALSSDAEMWAMYSARDPHMWLPIRLGVVPAGATKATHPQVRSTYKVLNLAVLYGQGPESIAARLGVELDESIALLRQHKELFAPYHAWSDAVATNAFHRGRIATRQGWGATVDLETRWRTWANYPIQATGAEIMRLTSVAMDRQGIDILAIIHDGWLLQARDGDEGRVRDVAIASAEWASRKVLGDRYPLRVDWSIHRDRYQDEDSREEWGSILAALPREVLYVPSEE